MYRRNNPYIPVFLAFIAGYAAATFLTIQVKDTSNPAPTFQKR